jgi:hypothetical protein
MVRSSGRGLPPWRMVHGRPVNAGYDTAGDDGHASAGHASNDGACGDGAGSGRGAELVRRPSAVPARHRRDGGVARPPVRRRVVVATARVVGRAARHEPSLNGARWLLRNGVLYIATGAWVLARRGWEARTNARYERLLRAAEAAGDYERLTASCTYASAVARRACSAISSVGRAVRPTGSAWALTTVLSSRLDA